jgi:cell division protease FtsH
MMWKCNVHDSTGQRNIILLNPILKLQKSLILRLLIEGYQRAIEILEQNKDKLNQLADIPLRKKIFKDDLETFGKRAFDKNLEEIVS